MLNGAERSLTAIKYSYNKGVFSNVGWSFIRSGPRPNRQGTFYGNLAVIRSQVEMPIQATYWFDHGRWLICISQEVQLSSSTSWLWTTQAIYFLEESGKEGLGRLRFIGNKTVRFYDSPSWQVWIGDKKTSRTVHSILISHNHGDLGPVQTSNFTCAKPNCYLGLHERDQRSGDVGSFFRARVTRPLVSLQNLTSRTIQNGGAQCWILALFGEEFQGDRMYLRS